MRFAALIAFSVALSLAFAHGAKAGSYTVTTTDDGGPGSLRQAIIDANAESVTSTIQLGEGLTYGLTIPNDYGGGPIVDENASATGDLDVSGKITIQGNGSTITGFGALGDRIFHVLPSGVLELDNVTVSGGFVCTPYPDPSGAGILNQGLLLLSVATVRDNISNCQGGGIANSGTANIDSSTITGNTAFQGGGIYNANFGNLTITGSTVSSNSAYIGGGGAIFNRSSLAIGESTIADNLGSGLYNFYALDVNLTNVTIARNNSNSARAGGIENEGGDITATNTIVALNQGGGFFDPGAANCRNTSFHSGGHNLSSAPACQSFDQPTDLVADPRLGHLGHFGGATETMPLLAGSPAIDAGDDGAFNGSDQRGYGNWGLSDIGAFEFIPGAHASFTFDPAQPLNGGIVHFASTSTTENGGDLSYYWDFGDGSTSTAATPDHAFSAPDHPQTYTVTLDVVDTSGASDEISQDVTAHPANEKPYASFSVNGLTTVNQPVSFDAGESSDNDGTIADYGWDWGDGTSEHGPDLIQPTHTYTSPGTYTVGLTVTDNGGRTDALSQDVTIRPDQLYVDAGWTGVAYGEDPDGAGPATAFGLDAFSTIKEAANAAQGGETIHVAAGTYSGEGFIELDAAGVHVLGAGRDVTHVGLARLKIDASDVLVSGLDLQGPGTWNPDTHVFDGGSGPVVRFGGSVVASTLTESRIAGGFRGVAIAGVEDTDTGASECVVSNNIITHNATGVMIDSATNNVVQHNELIDNGDADGSEPEAGILIVDNHAVGASGNVIQDNTITNTVDNGISVQASNNQVLGNTISNAGTGWPYYPQPSGIEIVRGSHGFDPTITNVEVDANTITDSGYAGIRLGLYANGDTIEHNAVAGTQNGGSAVLIDSAGASGNTIRRNSLTGNAGYGILQGNSDGNSYGNAAHRNNITGNGGGVLNDDSALLDATDNWWGAADGPSGAGPGGGQSVSSNVLFDPWATSPTCTGLNTCATTTALESSQNPSVVGDSVTFTATVTADGVTPSGSVRFSDGETMLGDEVALDSEGKATLTISDLAAGTHTILAQYVPGDGFEASGNSLDQLVRVQPNDDVANAQVISGESGTVLGSNVGATQEPNEPYPYGGRSIWYRWTAPTTGHYRFDTVGSNFDTVLAAGQGPSLPLSGVVLNDDCVGVQSCVEFDATAGQEYLIDVDGYAGSQGNVTLNWALKRLISVNDTTVTEGDSGTVDATFTVTLSSPSEAPVTVHYQTTNGSAVAPGDYTAVPDSTLTFAPGETSKTVTVSVKGDTLYEADESFYLLLSSPSGAQIGDDQGVGTIQNDDPPPPIASSGNVFQIEGDSGTTDAVFTVTLSSDRPESGWARPITVDYTTQDGTATAGSDYTATSGTITFPAGVTSRTISVPIHGDRLHEPDETFTLRFSNPVNTLFAADPSATTLSVVGTIVNDDPPGSGPRAVRYTGGCLTNTLAGNDDGSTGRIDLPFALNFFGHSYDHLWINNNGNVTFNGPMSTFTPFNLLSTATPLIAPFFADVDTRNAVSDKVHYGFTTVSGHPALCVDWADVAYGGVGYYSFGVNRLNSFQLLLISRDDVGAGDFDIEMNYDKVQWETGGASGGSNGLGGSSARMGFSNGVDTAFEQPGSAVPGSFLDTNTGSGLIYHNREAGTQLGRYVFPVRNGVAPTGGTISGIVFRNPPVSGALVSACDSGGVCHLTSSGGDGSYSITGLSPGTYTLRAFPPGDLKPGSLGPITFGGGTLAGQNIQVTGPATPPPGTTISPSNVYGGGIPTVYWHNDLTLSTGGCSAGGGSADYQVTLGGSVVRSGSLALQTGGSFSGVIAAFYPLHGNAHVAITAHCSDGDHVVEFDIYVDPSGVVKTVGGSPIAGATVTLYRSDDATGPFTAVPDGSVIMSVANRNNPSLTDAAGHFGWDVVSGYYKVRAEKTGCNAPGNPSQGYNETGVLHVTDSPITDLDIRLDCPTPNQPPVLDSVAIDQAHPRTNDTLTTTVTSHDPDGDPVTYSYEWLENGIPILGATGSSLDLSQLGNGDKGDAIAVKVTPNDGTVDGASLTSDPVTVGNTPPTLEAVSITPVYPKTNDTVSAHPVGYSDADGDAADHYSYQWFKNGLPLAGATGASLDLSQVGNGGKGDQITVSATPNDGTADGATVTSDPVTIANTPPHAGDDSGFSTGRNHLLTISASELLANDSDADGDTLSISSVAAGSNGGVSLSADHSAVTFTPQEGYTGPATFTYRAGDGADESNDAQVGITVTEPLALSLSLDSTASSVEAGASQVRLADVPPFVFAAGSAGPASAPAHDIPVHDINLSASPAHDIPVHDIGFATALSGPLGDVQLSSVPATRPGGWAAILQGTALEGAPEQSLTLRDVFSLSPAPAALQASSVNPLRLGQLDLSSSLLGSLSLSAIALGATPVHDIPVHDISGGGSTDTLANWCAILAGPPINCTNPSSLASTTILDLSLEGVPAHDIPAHDIPAHDIPAHDIPVHDIPVHDINLAASPVHDIPAHDIALLPGPVHDIPVHDILLAGSRLGTLSLRQIVLSGSPVHDIPVHDIPAHDIGNVINCGNPSIFNCASLTLTLGDAQAAGVLRAGATLNDIAGEIGALKLGDLGYYGDVAFGELGFYGDLTIGQLLPLLPDNITLADILIMLLSPDEFAWESTPFSQLKPQQFATGGSRIGYQASFSLSGGSAAVAASTQLKVSLPPGFRYVQGSAVLETLAPAAADRPVADPTISGSDLTFDVDGLYVGTQYRLDLTAIPALRLGAASATATGTPTGGDPVDAGASTANVTDTLEPNNDPATAPLLSTDSYYASFLRSSGDTDYYRVHIPAAGDRVTVRLSHLPIDADLVVYGPQSAGPSAAPAHDIGLSPLGDEGVALDHANQSLAPQVLQDIPLLDRPVWGASINRGTEDEAVVVISGGESGDFTIQVSGYNGASSDQPYMIRATVTPPATQPACTARSFPHLGDGVAGTLPGSIPANVNTLVLTNEKRLGDTYGAAGEARVVDALNANLAQLGALGYPTAVLPVEGDPAVAAAYTAWDANPCSADRANAVARAIGALVDGIRATHPHINFEVIGGGDDIVPFARLDDFVTTANEGDYASEVPGGNNEYVGSALSRKILSDDPYATSSPIAFFNRQLYVPDVAVGRLVETPEDIAHAFEQFVSFHGALDPHTAFTSGYDFLSDGSQEVNAALAAKVGAGNTNSLINETWTRQNLADAVLPAGVTSPDLLSINAHYNDHVALPAAQNAAQKQDDLFRSSDVAAAPGRLTGRTIFSMGCHAGYSVSDVIVGSSRLDWAQAYAQQGAVFAANTGYGYGDSDIVAYSERLMANFATGLDQQPTVGQALMVAKQQYVSRQGVFGVYDEKAMTEATFYGLPMYSEGPAHPPAPPAVPPASPDPATGLETSSFDVSPSFTLAHGQHGDYYTVAGGDVQVTHYRPAEPKLTQSVRPTAHGAIVEQLASQDHSGFNADFTLPVDDTSQPELAFGDAVFPDKIQTITSNGITGAAEQRSLVMLVGQFFTDSASSTTGTGIQRNFTHVAGKVYDSPSGDFGAPTFSRTDGAVVGSTAAFSVDVSDEAPSGPGEVKRVYVLFRDASGDWKGIDLARTPGTTVWTGGSPAVGDQIEFFVQAVDAAGNVAVSTRKGRYFEAAPAPAPAPGDLTATVTGPSGDNGWLTGAATVTLGGADTIEYSVDGGEFRPYTGHFDVTGDGIHRVDARSTDGHDRSLLVPIDARPPQIELRTPAAGATFHVGSHVVADFECSDTGSGAATCDGTQADGSTIDTSAARDGSFTVTAKDAAGNVATAVTHNYSVFGSPPPAPGAPTGSSPTQGGFMLGWTASTDPDGDPTTYTLEGKRASDAGFSVVASGLATNLYTFAAGAPPEGTWIYRARASDGFLQSDYSPSSAAIVVDRSAPNAPLTSTVPASPAYSGGGGWFKDTVAVHFAGNGDPALADGSAGSGVDPASVPTDQSFSTNGSHTATGSVKDLAGNSSAPSSQTVQVDASAPSISFSDCPSARMAVGTPVTVHWSASDGESGLASPASGSSDLATSSVGSFSASATATDNVGHTSTATCPYTVYQPNRAPTAPGAPTGPSPTQGGFMLGWTASTDPDGDPISYTLEQKHADQPDSAYTVLASGLATNLYTFAAGAPPEGTWTYRARATDGALSSANSPSSAAIVVDRSAPNGPLTSTVPASPAYSGGGGWFKDTVAVHFAGNGDPALPDGSAGSGVDPASLADQSFTTSGAYTATGTVKDLAGNTSAESSLPVQVDATAPGAMLACPTAAVVVGSSVNATYVASDDESGLATPSEGTVALNTATVGTFTASTTARDNVGHETSATCGYTVVSGTPGRADLSITAAATPSPAVEGGNVTYRLTIANGGPTPATGVVLADDLPDDGDVSSLPSGCNPSPHNIVVCSVGTIPVGGTRSIDLVVVAETTGTFDDKAATVGSGVDPNLRNNSIEIHTTVNAPPNSSCTILGTSKKDVLNGTPGNDVICGLGGDDTINGNGGNDTIFPGDGNDTVDGGAGNDRLFGDKGKDTLTGGAGTDSLYGGGNEDTLYARDGAVDRVDGGKDSDKAQVDTGTIVDVVKRIEHFLP